MSMLYMLCVFEVWILLAYVYPFPTQEVRGSLLWRIRDNPLRTNSWNKEHLYFSGKLRESAIESLAYLFEVIGLRWLL